MNAQALRLVESASKAPIGTTESPVDDNELARGIGRVLRELRKSHHLSLNDLAKLSGVSRSMLSQMESARSTPSVAVLYKIARAFEVPISSFLQSPNEEQPILLSRDDAQLKISAQGKCAWRSLLPGGQGRRVDFFEITLGPAGIEEPEPYAEGVWCNLTVSEGSLIVALKSRRHRVGTGDAFQFPAASRHAFINVGNETSVFYLVVRYPDSSRQIST
jgi:transcriptional regulator with XRE-family HTH domain